VVLFLSGGAVTVASGAKIRLINGLDRTPAGEAMIELVFNGMHWCELGRNG
jgi:hypothetical protein